MAIASFREGCLGCGDLKKATFWFVGPEAGGTPKYEALFERAWRELGGGDTCNAKDIHIKVADILEKADPLDDLDRKSVRSWRRLFDEGDCTIQRTWRDLIRLYLAYEGMPPGDDVPAIRSFQSRDLADKLALLEVRGGADQSVRRREGTHVESRSERIRQLVRLHRPKVLVFYGDTAQANSGEFGSGLAPWVLNPKWQLGKHGETTVGFTPHPNARGYRAEDWRGFGRALREMADLNLQAR